MKRTRWLIVPLSVAMVHGVGVGVAWALVTRNMYVTVYRSHRCQGPGKPRAGRRGSSLIGVGAPVIAVAAGAAVVGVGASLAAEYAWDHWAPDDTKEAIDEGLRDFGNGVKTSPPMSAPA